MTPEQLIAERQALEDQIRAALWPMLQSFYRAAPGVNVSAISIDMLEVPGAPSTNVLGRVRVLIQINAARLEKAKAKP